MNGSAFSTYVVIPYKALELFGAEQLGEYTATKRAIRHYCIQCGTPIFNLNSRYEGACMLYLGTVENNRALAPPINVYCEDRLPWLEGIEPLSGSLKGVEHGT
jgi:hypothetical protein